MSIYVITHKYIDEKPDLPDFYKWLYVGAFRNDDRKAGYEYDDTGDNISKKNSSFCELTGMYWIRHNCNDKIKGLVHYRRFFTHNVWSENEKYFYTEDEINTLLQKYQMIVSDRLYFSKGNIYLNYLSNHNENDLRLLEDIINKYEPDYSEAFKIAFSKNYLFPYNMFIASDEIFDKYSDWLLNLLFKLEQIDDLTGYDSYQARVFGFLSERLLNVWIIKNNISYVEVPTVQLGSRTRYKIRTQLEKRLKRPLVFLAKIDKMVGKNDDKKS